MSKGVNTTFAKCFIIFMATVILVQGVVYLAFAIAGIQLHKCHGMTSDLVGDTFKFVLNLIYFTSEDCGQPRIKIPAQNVDQVLNINFQKAHLLSDREFIFSICYAAISTVWCITSLLVLLTICCRLSKLIKWFCFWPWLISIMLGSALDAIASGFHINDILKTTSAESTFKYVGVQNYDQVIDYIKDYNIFFAIPAVVFTCITSRIVLIWLLNIFGSIFCMSLASTLSSNYDEERNQKQTRRPSSADTAVPCDTNSEIQEEPVAIRFRPSPEEVHKVRSTLEPVQKSPIPSPTIEPAEPYPMPVLRHPSNDTNSRVSVPKSPTTPGEASTYQISDAHPEKLDYPPNRYSAVPSQTRSITPELSAISPLNLRYSTADGSTLFPNQPHITQELRGQLPWSYTNIMNDLIAQKRIQSHLPQNEENEDENYPPIPVPDYTLHPPKKDRVSLGQDRLSQTGYSRW